MRNVISIDVINSCSCNAIAITDTKTNEIIIEVITGDANSPRLELIRYGDTYKSVTLNANASNLVELKESEWALSDSIQFRYVDQERTGELFTMYFPATINDIYVNMTSDTVFTVVSKSSSGGGGGTGGNVNVVDNLTSMSTTDALSANQGRVLKESLNVTNNVVSNLSGEVSDNSSDISTLQSKVSGNSSKLTELQSDVTDLGNIVSNNTTNIGNIQMHVNNNRFEISDLKGDVTELQSKVGEGLSVEVGTVTTAEAGTEASVTNSGTDAHAVLDFVIPKGDAGKNGVSVSSVAQTTTSTADGGTNVVTVTLSDGTKSTFNVKNGSKGSTGNGIKSTAVTYQASTSGTTVPTGTWSTTIPTVTAGNYLWTRVVFTYTDGTTATAYGVAKHGANGKDGSDANVSFTQSLKSGTKIGTLTLDGTSIDLYAPNAYTHPSYTARTGVPTANQTPAFGGTFSVSQPVSDATGHITGINSRTVKIPNNVATTSANGLMSSADKSKLDITNIAYGTCATAGATSAKEVTIDGNSNWELKKGSIIVVKFTNTNSASNVTLNVNGTGAKSIWYDRAVYTGNSSTTGGYANRYTIYMYDGTNWVWIGHSLDANNTYTNASLGQGYGTCATAEATTAKVVTLSSYALTVGGIVSVKFTYAVPASATMNINSKGAKAIYHRGSAIKAGVIKAGDIATFIYDGTQYHLLAIDRTTTGTLTTSDVVDNLTSTSTTAPLSAKQGKVINDKVNNLKEHGYSLLIDQKVTTTEQTFTTYNGRKVSDYDFIVLRMGLGSLEVRTTLFLATSVFRATNRQFYLDCHAGNGSVYNQILVTYVSDTQIKAKCTVSPSATIYLNVDAFKIIDKSTL